MGYTHEFSCDRCGVITRNTNGDADGFITIDTGTLRLMLCTLCLGEHDKLREAHDDSWRLRVSKWADTRQTGRLERP